MHAQPGHLGDSGNFSLASNDQNERKALGQHMHGRVFCSNEGHSSSPVFVGLVFTDVEFYRLLIAK